MGGSGRKKRTEEKKQELRECDGSEREFEPKLVKRKRHPAERNCGGKKMLGHRRGVIFHIYESHSSIQHQYRC